MSFSVVLNPKIFKIKKRREIRPYQDDLQDY